MTKAELIADTLFLSNTVASQYKPVDALRNLNFYYDEAVTEIWKADGLWKFDKGHDTLPIATTDLVANQKDYQLPSEARRIERVEIMYDNAWKVLTPILSEDSGVYNYNDPADEAGEPRHYYIKGRSLFLTPISKNSKAQGVAIFLSRSVDYLVDDTDEPKIDREFQRYLTIGATRDWYFAKGNIQKANEMERKLNDLREQIVAFYSKRNQDYKSRIKIKLEKYN